VVHHTPINTYIFEGIKNQDLCLNLDLVRVADLPILEMILQDCRFS